jgi:hypothetical protein
MGWVRSMTRLTGAEAGRVRVTQVPWKPSTKFWSLRLELLVKCLFPKENPLELLVHYLWRIVVFRRL